MSPRISASRWVRRRLGRALRALSSGLSLDRGRTRATLVRPDFPDEEATMANEIAVAAALRADRQ
ncbi:MAG: hypothetical protein H6811_03065 [Phycisphaeraceae bacterium]|nr:hypothetical protein [Phycisphaeraceae bacterium]